MPLSLKVSRSWIALLSFALGACDRVFALPAPIDGSNGGNVDAADAPPVAPGVIAHYRMESMLPVVADETGRHDGYVVNGVAVVTGRDGGALHFPAVSPIPHVVVPNDAAWDLVAAIEIWVNPAQAAEGEQRGILSRDSFGTFDGHLTLVQLDDRYVLRIQRESEGAIYLCSDQAPASGRWIQIGINLGAPQVELWVDGVRGTRSDQFVLFGQTATCGTGDARTIIGNDDPWVFGALAAGSAPGTTSQIANALLGGAIDDVIIWNARQRFDGTGD
jgi:hypothetical protein